MAQDILLKMYGSNPELFGQSTGWAQRSICALIEKCGVNPHERTGGAPSAIELISLVGKADFTDAALKANACREAGELEVLMIKAASSAQKRRRSL
jgi:hypothetical protein